MKGIILLLAILYCFQTAQGQETDTSQNKMNQEMYDYFHAKHKRQKKTGLILLGSGLAATGIGIIIASSSNSLDDGWVAGGLISYAGILTTTASVPVLIISGSNKRKAETYMNIGEYRRIDFAIPDSKVVSVGVRIDF